MSESLSKENVHESFMARRRIFSYRHTHTNGKWKEEWEEKEIERNVFIQLKAGS